MSRETTVWLTPREQGEARRYFMAMLLPGVLLALAALFWWLSGAGSVNCINSMYWCDDNRFHMQIASRLCYGGALLLFAFMAWLTIWRTLRFWCWPVLTPAQYQALRPAQAAECAAAASRHVRVQRGALPGIMAGVLVIASLILLLVALQAHLLPVIYLYV